MHDVNGVESGGTGAGGIASGAGDGSAVGASGNAPGGGVLQGSSFGTGPWPIEARGSLRLFVWPRFDEPAHLERLVAALAPVLGDERVTLVVRHDARTDPERDVALDALFAALAEVCGDIELEVLVEDHPFERDELSRLGAAVHGVLDLGGRDRFELARLGHVPLTDAAAVAAWRLRAQAAGGLPEPLARALAELGGGTALWLGGPERGAAGEIATHLADGGHLVVAAPSHGAREARAVVFAAERSERIDWIDLGALELASLWDEPLELLVFDVRRGVPAALRTFAAWRVHLVPGAEVVLLGDDGTCGRSLEGEGLRVRTRSSGASTFTTPRQRARAAE
jgi:hypothetical protein